VIFIKDLSADIRNTVPISLFNKGLAGQIFSDVKDTGAKVVIKNNIPVCVLLSPEVYIEMIDEINDARLINKALNRLDDLDDSKLISQDAFDKKFGFTEKDLERYEEVEFE
jgi:PHD/YefM family antitoxin component YafN of YafNO toxin-antitoxin module